MQQQEKVVLGVSLVVTLMAGWVQVGEARPSSLAQQTVYCVGTDAAGVTFGGPCDGHAAALACEEASAQCGATMTANNWGISGDGCFATCGPSN